MSEEEARTLVENEGYTVIELLEQQDDSYCFLCSLNGEEVDVCVIDGVVNIAPT